LKYAVNEATYAAWARERQSRRRTTIPDIKNVVVEGVSEKEAAWIRNDFEKEFANTAVDRRAVEEAILRLTGTDRYEVVGYHLLPTADGTTLAIRVTPKSYGPPFLLPALDLQNIDANTFALDLRARVAVYDTFISQSEIRADFGIGSRQFAAVEFYRRLGQTGLFVAPRGYFTRRPVNAYNDDGDFVAEYREKRTGAGLDIGFSRGLRDEVRFGYDIADVRTRRRIGEGALPEADGSERFLSLRWIHDGQNSPVIPSHGIYSRAEVRYYFDTPTLTFENGTRDAREFAQADGRLSWFTRWHERHRVFLFGGGGTSFNDDPGYNRFSLGGPLNLGAFNQGEIRGDNYLLGGGGLLWNWFRLPDVLGGNAYLGGWFENGSAFDQWDDAKYYADISGGFIMETLFGPFFIGGAVSLNEGETRFYVSLAPFVRY
jgi:NTE family protein